MDTQAPKKPIHSLILDTGPLIKNAVSISTIINSAEEIFTTPAIISEIRDEATRSRVQTTLMPFLKVRTPSPASYDAVIAFSKKTGDHPVLSRQDLGILALAYEIHCERNGGPWGLREAPKQPVKVRPGEENNATAKENTDQASGDMTTEKSVITEQPGETAEAGVKEQESWTEARATKPKRLHKKKEKKRLARELEAEKQGEPASTGEEEQSSEPVTSEEHPTAQTSIPDVVATEEKEVTASPEIKLEVSEQSAPDTTDAPEKATKDPLDWHKEEQVLAQSQDAPASTQEISVPDDPVEPRISLAQAVQEQTSREQTPQEEPGFTEAHADPSQDLSALTLTPPPTDEDDDDSDGDWITPSNLSTHQAADSGLIAPSATPTPQLDVATMTTDFAMQNVLLQLNLSLLSTNMQRIRHLTSKVLRCHACFLVVHDTSKQFCPRCGGASLLRVNCSTNSKGEFRLHLAKNYQYNKRGDKYSIPKPIAGTANGKWNGIGGGKGGWGRDLVLSEDQKEYAVQVQGERRARDLMDEDYLPGILTGDRASRTGGRPKVGAGKNVNGKRRV